MSIQLKTNIDPRDVSIYELDKFLPQLKGLVNGSDYEIECDVPFVLSWNFELEIREWGIKDMSWYATGIEGSFDVVCFDTEGEEKSRERIDFDFSPFADNVEMELEIDNLSLAPSALEIDYSFMGVEVL